VSSLSLLSYLRDDCRKQAILISKSHGDSNRCTPCKGNPINTTRTLSTSVHVRLAYGSCGQSLYVTTFHESSTEMDRVTASEKRDADTIHSTPADRSTGPYPVSLLSQPMKQWRKPNIYRQKVTRFTGLISQEYNRYVQYLLTGGHPSVLN
jgi:hypothetical protein